MNLRSFRVVLVVLGLAGGFLLPCFSLANAAPPVSFSKASKAKPKPTKKKKSAAQAWMKQLLSSTPELIEQAIHKLAKLEKQAVPSLIKAMKDKRYTLRHHVARVLFLIGPKANDALVSLINSYNDTILFQSMKKGRMNWFVPHFRARILRAVASVGRNSKNGLPLVLQASKHPNVIIRSAAITALGDYFSTFPKVVIPLLSQVLQKDKVTSVKSLAAQSIGTIGRPLKTVLSVLRKAMMNPEWQVQLGATMGLAKLGPKAEPALPEILRALLGSHWMLRYYAVVAIRKVGNTSPGTIRALREVLANPLNHPKVKLEAQITLEKLSGKSEPASKPSSQPTSRPSTEGMPQPSKSSDL